MLACSSVMFPNRSSLAASRSSMAQRLDLAPRRSPVGSYSMVLSSISNRHKPSMPRNHPVSRRICSASAPLRSISSALARASRSAWLALRPAKLYRSWGGPLVGAVSAGRLPPRRSTTSRTAWVYSVEPAAKAFFPA